MIMISRCLLAGTALTVALGVAGPAFAADPAPADQAPATPAAPPSPPSQIVVTAHRLDTARESIKPSLGASVYTLGEAAIQNLPGSDNQPIQDIILQMPGVSQDQFGQFHVRDEHNGVQYRLNGVIIPESVAVFGQTLSPRLIQRLDLVTGTLPAQYGLRTAGIIDITTKSGLKDSTTVSLYGGSHDTIEPSVQLSGSSGASSWFVSGDYKHTGLGIDNVTGSNTALHDKSNQFNGFGYVDRIVGDSDRISLTGGYTNQHYQIPNPPGQIGSQTDFAGNPVSVGGVTQFPSEALNEQQLQTFGFAALSWLHSAGAFSSQVSAFGRVATLDYRPDYTGELLFNGTAQYASKRVVSVGAQLDSAYKLGDFHTLRFGGLINQDRAISYTDTAVFQTDAAGGIFGAPALLNDFTDVAQRSYSVYLQDEWHLVPHVVLNYGLRFDEVDGIRDERQLSPRINLVWSPPGGFTGHAGFARNFSPAPFELVASQNLAQVAGTTAAPQASLDVASYAQRENYWDAGFQQKIGRHFSFGLDGFYRTLTHMVDEGQFGAPIILTPFNYAKGRIYGVELTANYAKGGLSAYGNLSYDKAQGTQIDSNQYNFSAADLAYIANHWIYVDHNQTWTGSAGASYHWNRGALDGTRISADMVYGSGLRRDETAPDGSNVPNGSALPGYVTFNASIGHKFAGSGYDVHIDVQNVANAVYEIRDGTGVGVGAPSFGPRRGFFVGVSKTF
ncbi:TonB-dependent receptor [Novosphingobium sp.]|uniref:TonB-dependent receptor n=1 Tax=Novosphingobium sp. TaxID=1874826 RepID=UPI003D0A10CA